MRPALLAPLALTLLAACDHAPDPSRPAAPTTAASAAIATASASAVAPAPSATAPTPGLLPPPAAPAAPADPDHDTLVPVTSKAAPLLSELGRGQNTSFVLHTGDLLYFTRELPAIGWHARMAGVEAQRDGAVAEVRLVAADAPQFTFQADLGPAVTTVSAARVCAKAVEALPPEGGLWRETCPMALRRAALGDGRVVAYQPCGIGPCPVALVRGEDVRVMSLDGVTGVELHPSGDKPSILVTTRWVKANGNLTGGTLVVVALDGPAPKVVSKVQLDEVDARDTVLVEQRDVHLEVSDAELRVVGERRTVARDTAAVSKRSKIDEHHPLPHGR
jgi:hypothetical protein